VRLIITQENQVVAIIEDWQGPVPQKGDYIHHPRGDEPVPGMFPDGTMIVKTHPAWGIIARPRNGEGYFTGAAEPFVEVTV
jgi:hypothetical protein